MIKKHRRARLPLPLLLLAPAAFALKASRGKHLAEMRKRKAK
jgi:hypothetical protein